MNKNIAVIRGDGIGPEIIGQTLRVLDHIAELYGHSFTYTDVDMGGCAIDKYEDPLPDSELEKMRRLGQCSARCSRRQQVERSARREASRKGLLRLRAGMGVYSNNRPAKIWRQLADASPLKSSIVDRGIDFIIVRELIGGIYFGEHITEGNTATDVLRYREPEIERIGRIGFETARRRSRRLCSVEKKQCSRLEPYVEASDAPPCGRVSRCRAV